MPSGSDPTRTTQSLPDHHFLLAKGVHFWSAIEKAAKGRRSWARHSSRRIRRNRLALELHQPMQITTVSSTYDHVI